MNADQMPSTRFDNEHPQPQSILFQLPGELRDSIFISALSTFEDKERAYDLNTYWARPHYSAPRKSELALLRTCKRVHREAWHLPLKLADHTFWLSAVDRAPKNKPSMHDFAKALKTVHKHYGDIEVDQIRFFAQMWVLENTQLYAGVLRLPEFLCMPHLHPLTLTITIRHTDWWHWESDEWLHIKSGFARDNVFPASTRRICLELETTSRRQDQLHDIVHQMKQTWFFKKLDGTLLSARETDVDARNWRGSSTWAEDRWIRDEIEPDCIEYCVATVIFTHEPRFSEEFGSQSASRMQDLYTNVCPQQIGAHAATIHRSQIIAAKVPPGTKPEDAMRMIDEYQRNVSPEVEIDDPSSEDFDSDFSNDEDRMMEEEESDDSADENWDPTGTHEQLIAF